MKHFVPKMKISIPKRDKYTKLDKILLKRANLGDKVGPKWPYWPKMAKIKISLPNRKKYKYVYFSV